MFRFAFNFVCWMLVFGGGGGGYLCFCLLLLLLICPFCVRGITGMMGMDIFIIKGNM